MIDRPDRRRTRRLVLAAATLLVLVGVAVAATVATGGGPYTNRDSAYGKPVPKTCGITMSGKLPAKATIGRPIRIQASVRSSCGAPKGSCTVEQKSQGRFTFVGAGVLRGAGCRVTARFVAPPGTALVRLGFVGVDKFKNVKLKPGRVRLAAPPDRTKPEFSSLEDQFATATDPAGIAVNYPLPKATDDSGKVPTVNCIPPPGSTFPVGDTRVTCTARDAAGNVATGTFTVTVELNQP